MFGERATASTELLKCGLRKRTPDGYLRGSNNSIAREYEGGRDSSLPGPKCIIAITFMIRFIDPSPLSHDVVFFATGSASRSQDSLYWPPFSALKTAVFTRYFRTLGFPPPFWIQTDDN